MLLRLSCRCWTLNVLIPTPPVRVLVRRFCSYLGVLCSGSVLLLHSNEAEHAGVLLEVLRNVTALVPPRVAVSVVSRDDRPMPSEHMLPRWRGVRASWRRAGLTPPRWFVQNVAAAAELARPGSEGIHPVPISPTSPHVSPYLPISP